MPVSISGTTGYAGPLGAITVDTTSIQPNAVTPAKMSRTGSSGQVLTSNGSGADPSYQALPASGVTSITAGNGLTGGTITSTGTISLDYYTGSSGTLSSYPLGTVLLSSYNGYASLSLNTNAYITAYRSNNPPYQPYTVSSGATALAGTWAIRGGAYDGCNGWASWLMQRVS